MNHMRFLPLLAAAAALLFSFSSPAADKNSAQAPAPTEGPAAPAATVDATYLIQPGDFLDIFVWKEPDLRRPEVLVRPDGGLSFPLAGDVHAEGSTVPQLEKELTKRIRKFIPDALVTVAMKAPQGNQFFVVGRVNKAGPIQSYRPLDVMQAIALAGGPTPFASVNKIKVLRRENGVQRAIPFRYGRVEKGKSLKENIVLQSGDVVVVP